MLRWFKRHFIPHKGNDHQPHFLRDQNMRFLILSIFMIELVVLVLPYIPFFDPANNKYLAAILPAVLGDLTNENRQAQQLPILTVNPILDMAAELKAKDMAEKGYFAHTSPEGKAPWYWFKQVGYEYQYAGENLAIDFTDSKDVTLAWMNSPTHKANIMKNSYTEMGTGIAMGTFEGNPTIFVAQVYGKPAIPPSRVPDAVGATASIEMETAPPSKVMGASDEAIPVSVPTDSVSTNTNIKETYSKPNMFEKYMASPRHLASIFLIVIALLVAIAIIFKLFIRMDKRHPVLITNGLVVLVLVFGVYVANEYVARNKMAVITSFASFQEDRIVK